MFSDRQAVVRKKIWSFLCCFQQSFVPFFWNFR